MVECPLAVDAPHYFVQIMHLVVEVVLYLEGVHHPQLLLKFSVLVVHHEVQHVPWEVVHHEVQHVPWEVFHRDDKVVLTT